MRQESSCGLGPGGPQNKCPGNLLRAAGPGGGEAPDSGPGFKQVLPASLSGLEAGNLIFAHLHSCVPTACLPHPGAGGLIALRPSSPWRAR